MEKIELTKDIVDQMFRHANQEKPNECCGVIIKKKEGEFELHTVKNIEQSPFRYNMDAQEFYTIYQEAEKNNWDMWGFYHSHTHTEAYPSETDRKLAAWTDSYYLVVSLQDEGKPIVRCFSITDGNIHEKQLQLT